MEQTLEEYLWSLGMEPRFVGQKYYCCALQKIREGSRPEPALLREVGVCYGRDHKVVYDSMRRLQDHVQAKRYKQYRELMPEGRSLYEFLYVLSKGPWQ